MKVIVGLGNPGTKYAGTRHNIGFDVVAYLAQSPTASPVRAAFQAAVVELQEAGEKVLLVQPQTFMNLSGRTIRAIVDFYKLPLAELLIICDDLNLPLGKLRVRTKGSHGGQNGLRNIQEMLGTDEYTRLRIGIGQPSVGEAVDYVLGRFRPGEQSAVQEAIAKAAQGVATWIRDGATACMNLMNAGEAPAKPKVKPKPKETPTTLAPDPKDATRSSSE